MTKLVPMAIVERMANNRPIYLSEIIVDAL
jgi:hypothetical protein